MQRFVGHQPLRILAQGASFAMLAAWCNGMEQARELEGLSDRKFLVLEPGVSEECAAFEQAPGMSILETLNAKKNAKTVQNAMALITLIRRPNFSRVEPWSPSSSNEEF